jgi:hypothetical protein
MPATPISALPRACHLSIVPWGISLRSSLSRRRRLAYLLPQCLSSYLEDSPAGPPQDHRPPQGINDKRIAIGPRLPDIFSGRRYGSPPRMRLSGWSLANCPPGLDYSDESPVGGGHRELWVGRALHCCLPEDEGQCLTDQSTCMSSTV